MFYLNTRHAQSHFVWASGEFPFLTVYCAAKYGITLWKSTIELKETLKEGQNTTIA